MTGSKTNSRHIDPRMAMTVNGSQGAERSETKGVNERQSVPGQNRDSSNPANATAHTRHTKSSASSHSRVMRRDKTRQDKMPTDNRPRVKEANLRANQPNNLRTNSRVLPLLTAGRAGA